MNSTGKAPQPEPFSKSPLLADVVGVLRVFMLLEFDNSESSKLKLPLEGLFVKSED
jgi:hypothetical protein